MVFSRCSEREQTAARAGEGDERGVKNGGAEDEDRSEPGGQRGRMVQAELQGQGGHQETEEHRAAIAHENLSGFEIPAEETGGGAQDGSCQRGHQGLAVEVSEHGEENGSHGSDTGAEPVHVIEDAERSGDADDPDDGESGVHPIAEAAAKDQAEDLRVNAAEEKNHSSQGHGGKKFYLVMQPAAVVEETDNGNQGGAAGDADDLGAGWAVENNQNGQHNPAVDGEAAKKRDGFQVNFTRPGQIHHADANGQRPDGYCQKERC